MSRLIPLNESAVSIFRGSLRNVNRVLILGGTGWFGRTALAMMANLDLDTYIVASQSRVFSVEGSERTAKGWNYGEIERFEPDVVLDFAYVTVDKFDSVGLARYNHLNSLLAEQLYFVASLPSTKRVVTVSSGASIRLPHALKGHPAGESYALGKQAIEAKLAKISSDNEVSVAIARAWSVSGGHVQNPRGYALSGMILDGLESGSISVSADYLVYRRYSAVEELLALALASSETPGFTEIDSGGFLVEIEELAYLISALLPGSKVVGGRRDQRLDVVDSYFSDANAWAVEIERTGLEPLSLENQVENVARALAG